jgi:hypothetical protein
MFKTSMPMEYEIIESEIAGYLSGLSEDQVSEVLALYHQNKVKISDIIQRYNLEEIYIGDFKNHLPSSVCKDYVCPDCLVYSWRKHIGRGEQSIPFCPKCHTYMYSEYDAKTIHTERALKEAQIKKLNLQPVICLGNILPFQIITLERFFNLDFESKVFIGTIAANCKFAILGSVPSWQIKKMKFYPQPALQREIKNRLNLINNGVDLGNIEIDKELLKALQNPSTQLESTMQERLDLWKKIAFAEVSEIFENQMHECGFYGYQDEHTDQVLYSLLEDYSVAQIYNVIWRSVKKAATEYAKTDNRTYAASTVLNYCLKHIAYKEKNEEIIRNYNRHPYCRQSKISQYYFDAVLKIGDNGFDKRPSQDYLLSPLS